MSVLERYQRNYDQIARDHISHWRETGNNPFQDPFVLRANEDATVAVVEQHLQPGDRILDAGCGMGDLLLRFPSHERVGVDISWDYLEIGWQRKLDVRQFEIEKMPWRSEFDMVICTDVLEHVFDLNAVVRRLLRVLRKGGILIARTPNEEALSITTDPYEFVHVRRFDQATMYLLFHKIFGCQVLETPINGDVLHAVVRK